MTRRLARALLSLWLSCAPAIVLAQAQANVPMRPMTASFASSVALSFSARDFLDHAVEKKLQNGLPQTMTMRVYAYDEHGREPLSLTAVSCRVVYDLWEGVYRIERQTEQADKTLSAKTIDKVVQLCLDMPRLSVTSTPALRAERGKRIYFGVIVELNPMSQDTVQRIRRWLAQPSDNQLDGNAFFGSFVSIFVTRKMGNAEKTLAFRSELFSVPP
ncbi:MAG TPA: hypothetical protein VF331_25370 [Polyangiales bacterium]